MKWKILDTTELIKSKFFRLRTDKCELPDGMIMEKYYVMEFVDWVNVIPVTSSGNVVLVKQYRHAGADDFLEVPGGSTDPEQVGNGDIVHEDPQLAAERELLEETGYKGSEIKYLGHHFPNPAMQSNKMHTYLALNCERVAEQNLDPYERIEVVELPAAEVLRRLDAGEFRHSIIACSLTMARRELEKFL